MYLDSKTFHNVTTHVLILLIIVRFAQLLWKFFLLFGWSWYDYLICVHITQQKQNIYITFVQRRLNVFDVSPTLHKCYTDNSDVKYIWLFLELHGMSAAQIHVCIDQNQKKLDA